jgi:hypothetical protein
MWERLGGGRGRESEMLSVENNGDDREASLMREMLNEEAEKSMSVSCSLLPSHSRSQLFPCYPRSK